MNYREWLDTVPFEISNDPIWKLEVYRLALFAGDIGWHDVLALSKNSLTRSTADQLNRSLGSISANLTEGYSRSKGLDRARFFEYASVLPEKVVTGITSHDIFWMNMSSNIAWN